MAEYDDLEFDFGPSRRLPFDESEDSLRDLFEDRTQSLEQAYDEVFDDFESDSANDDYLDGSVPDSEYDNDDLLDDEFEYVSTPPGAFLRSCMRQLERGPSTDAELDDSAPASVRISSAANDSCGPSYLL